MFLGSHADSLLTPIGRRRDCPQWMIWSERFIQTGIGPVMRAPTAVCSWYRSRDGADPLHRRRSCQRYLRRPRCLEDLLCHPGCYF